MFTKTERMLLFGGYAGEKEEPQYAAIIDKELNPVNTV